MSIRLAVVCSGVALVLAGALSGACLADDEASKAATEHLLKGRYEEAAEAFAGLLKGDETNVAALLGLSRSLEAADRVGEARECIDVAIGAVPKNADLLARRAELQLGAGLIQDAAESAAAAIKLNDDHLRARIVQARAFVETGDLKAADDGFRWFVRFYNRVQPEDAESLLLVGDGAVEYARWHSVSAIFNFIVNTLCPDALKNNELSWQAHFVSGARLLEKYNRAEALPDLEKALTINPRAVEVIVKLGEAALQQHDIDKGGMYAKQALEIRPQSVIALQLQADVLLMKSDVAGALAALEQARKVNPVEQGTLGRIAACFYLLDVRGDAEVEEKRVNTLLANLDAIEEGTPENPTRLEELIIEVAGRNPKPGHFLTAFGEGLETKRKLSMAEKAYLHAARVMPQLSEPKTQLGMLYMQIGRSKEAEQILNDAFEADPFHVRVSNMRKVLGVLSQYETITTDHFVIRVDAAQDRVLGEYLAEYLEEVYAELVNLYDYEPPQRTTFEIYSNAKGLSAHQWFSARMVGLPWIQTIGASTGMMVALSSPTAAEKPYNWARVVKHEFVHVVTLQQTRFNIPHWFTEALAVTSENVQRPAVWNKLLLERVPAGKIWKLDELTQVFVRPETPLDWQFAYCQSRLYARYIIEKYGTGSIAKMLELYRNNVPTNDVIAQVFEIPADEFHAGYTEFLKRIVSEELGGAVASSIKSIAELEKEHLAAPDDPAASAAYAEALFNAKRRQQARELAAAALAKNPQEPLAAVVIAELELLGSDLDAAANVLRPALNLNDPHPQVLGLLAKIRMQQSRWADAVDLYEMGIRKLQADKTALPQSDEWLKGLAAAYVKLNANDRLGRVLEMIAGLDGDNATVRKKLAELAVEAGDVKTAKKWAQEALFIDVRDAGLHTIMAQAFDAEGDAKRADRERRMARELGAQ